LEHADILHDYQELIDPHAFRKASLVIALEDAVSGSFASAAYHDSAQIYVETSIRLLVRFEHDLRVLNEHFEVHGWWVAQLATKETYFL
jgi:hypothetical protein